MNLDVLTSTLPGCPPSLLGNLGRRGDGDEPRGKLLRRADAHPAV